MKKLIISPLIILVLQILGYFGTYYFYKYGHADAPVGWAMFNLIAFFNAIFLIFSYFFYFKARNENKFWLIPISIAIITVLILIICYIIMNYYKYK